MRSHNKPRHVRKRSRTLPTVASVLLALLCCIFASIYIRDVIRAKREDRAFAELAAIKNEAEITMPSPSIASSDTDPSSASDNTDAIPTPPPVLPQYAELHEMNPDLVGWLKFDNTNIDYPIVRNVDSPGYYLRHAFDGSPSESGTPFIDGDCDMDSDCFIVHGHNMNNGSMFGEIKRYEQSSFWEQNKYFTLDSVYEQRSYEVIAAIYSRVLLKEEEGFRYYYASGDLTEEEFAELRDWISSEAIYDTGVTPEYGDQIVLLSTCNYHITNGRFVLAARRAEHAA